MSYKIEENPNGEFYKKGARYNIEPINHDDDINATYQYAFDNGFIESYKIDQYNGFKFFDDAKTHHCKSIARDRWHYHNDGMTLTDAGIETNIASAGSINIKITKINILYFYFCAIFGENINYKLSNDVFVELTPDQMKQLAEKMHEKNQNGYAEETNLKEKINQATTVEELLQIKWDL